MTPARAMDRPGRAARALSRLEIPLSRVFAAGTNPFHHLGALTIFFFYVALVTGIYLFIFYRTSLQGAWESLEYLSREQWYAGGIMRSLHRYASDAAVIVLSLHLIRELLRHRLTGPRWFSWVTGLPLIWIVIIFGISGYWMVWDELAQYVAVSTAQLVDWLPIFTDPMSRNFISNEAVSSRLFTLIAFIHLVGLPIILVLGLWFHLLRVRQPRIHPPKNLMIGSMFILLLLALINPVFSQAPADLDRVPTSLEIDWFYLAFFPLQSLTSASVVWALTAGGTLLLAVLPWVMPGKKQPVAEVHLADCTGCTFCAEDCPYGAIDMVERTDGRNFKFEARVNADLCVSCGICTGACPSSSPFRQREPLTTGIEMPHFTIQQVRQQIDRGRDRSPSSILIFGCDHGPVVETLAARQTHTVTLPCVGMVPPSAIDYAMRSTGYAGVAIAGCENCDCHHRLGVRWTRERIARARQPGLRQRVPRDRLLTIWLKRGDENRLEQQLESFRIGLEAMAVAADNNIAPSSRKREVVE